MKNLLLTGLTLLSLVLATTSSATAESLEPMKSSGNLGSSVLRADPPDANPNYAPIPPAPTTDNTITTTNCPKPISGESVRSCSTGNSSAARKRAQEAAETAND